ncbi:hypothetical protein [Kibdelosporangium aridum]|uniref:Uncharacterized protein n=1 Tax=Kibdelosporangium aridum TaxID=2030 RepID=A0A1W2FZG3_KIBAR|nr:hypothetical protein [Kibdelosporangium aridum]SMD27330.1 hypothetical protein SAMN05661093_10933 [Kibdelosporangium aridum]
MLTPLVAGLFALAGVTLGVFLEPVKARVAARTRLREDRALRCAELVEAATAASGAIVWLFGTVRIAAPPLAASEATIAEVEQRYWSVRNDLKKAVLLIRLIGPSELIASAVAVSDSDLELRRLWFDREPAARQSNSPEIAQALHANTRALDEFADLARRLTALSRS